MLDNCSIMTLTDAVTKQITSFDPNTRGKTVTIFPNETKTIVDYDGCGVATRFWLTFPGWFWRHWDEEAKNDQRVLRLTILRIYFDGCAEPSVEAPIGDFFGVGHCEYRHYTSKYLGMSSGGFYSYFPMPFSKNIRIEVANLHPEIRIDLFFNLNLALLPEHDPKWGYFHAAFHCGKRLGHEELPVLDVRGKGQYVGCTLSIQGEPQQYLAYLEAPEYIEIDGREDLAIYGTGMEDYFNAGWYFRDGEFCCETHGVPIKDSLRSMTSMYRFHEMDRISFQQSMYMSFRNPWDKERLKPYRFSVVAYYYMDHAAGTGCILPPAEELTDLYRMRDFDVPSIP